jgi:hypothetical protein
MILLPEITYLLKVLLLSAVLLGFYYLFLRKYAAHTFNRYYLLAAVFSALKLPPAPLAGPHTARSHGAGIPRTYCYPGQHGRYPL